MSNTKKYVSLARLANFLDNIKDRYAQIGHKHTISDVTNLQSTLNNKVAQTSLDTHISDTSVHITSTERSNWNAAKTHADSAHAPSDAQANQNAFSYVKVGNTSVAADNATDTLTVVAGTNVTITPDATSDEITISAKDTTYSAGAGISLSGTTFSNSGVRSVATGSDNGTISVNTNGTSASVAVKGLGSAAYTDSTAYDSVGTAQTKSDEALASAKTYADTKISDMVGSSSVSTQISTHNISISAHNDIRTLIADLTGRLNALADSDDTTLDQLSEIVSYIKSNRTLIEEVTTNKVNVSDIVDNLTTNISNKPLSAAQGVIMKSLIDAKPQIQIITWGADD